jgi:hypothetical protein
MYTKRAGSSDIAERPQKRTRAKLPPPPTNPQSFTRRHWTAEEDEALRAAMADIVPHRWKLIAERVPGRDHIQCLQRWQKVLDPSLVKVRLGIARHSRCAPQPPHRSHALCAPPPAHHALFHLPLRSPWRAYASPVPCGLWSFSPHRRPHPSSPYRALCLLAACQGFWTGEEDQIVIAMKSRGCSSWVEMAKAVRGRNPKQVGGNSLPVSL